MEAAWLVFVLGLVNCQVAHIVTSSTLFMPLRIWAMGRGFYQGYLFNCFLCFGTWVGLMEALVTIGYFHWFNPFIDTFAAWFSIACVGRILNEAIAALKGQNETRS